MRLLLALIAGLACAGPAISHDIPDQIVLRGFVKPAGDRLHFVVRVPLVMLLNMNLPKRGPGYIDLANAGEKLQAAAEQVAREIPLFEDGRELQPSRAAGRISQASDASFAAYDSAVATIAGPRLPESTDVFWNQGFFDAHLEYPIRSDRSGYSLDMRLAPGLTGRLKLMLRYLPPGGETRAYELPGGAGLVLLDPRWYQAAGSFVKSGFRHILDGWDHLLFLLCLVLPFRRLSWTLVGVITAFTVAHSITLIAAAYGVVPSGNWFPPLVETLIAASIIYMAIENVLRPNLARRWVATAAFGLIHGFGFSFVLASEMQLAGEHLLVSLLAFNIGIELGQLAFIAVAIPLLALAISRLRLSEAVVTAAVSVFVGHAAWHWLTERWEALARAQWPQPEPLELALWLVLAVALAALASALLRRPAVLRGGDAEAGLKPH